jgi:flagellar biosynthetic protein FliP
MAAALAFVLLLIGIAMRALRRFTTGAVGRGRVPLQVVQRVALGPKQGIALVRVGGQVLAVSVGEGGIRPLLELQGEEREALLAPEPEPARPLALPGGRSLQSFQQALRTAIGTGAVLALLLGGPAAAHAQAVPTPRPAAPATVTGVNRASGTAAADAQRTLERLDDMTPRLAPRLDLKVGEPAQGGLRLSGTVGVVVMMGLLTLLPTLILMMTSFTRVLIVLHFLRQALGTQSAPPAQLLSALALLLTGFIMAPTLSEVNRTALTPWMDGAIDQGQMMTTAAGPFRTFMLAQTRESDLANVVSLSRTPDVKSADDVPLVVLMSAFVTSELKTSFQIGFALFLPFIIIDVVVSSVLMSMGMFMLPPAMISLPFKLLLFVLVDGWTLVVQGLVQSFH